MENLFAKSMEIMLLCKSDNTAAYNCMNPCNATVVDLYISE